MKEIANNAESSQIAENSEYHSAGSETSQCIGYEQLQILEMAQNHIQLSSTMRSYWGCLRIRRET